MEAERIPSGLYVVGTPIGNLGDFSSRARSVLEAVDFIAAEDTRVSLKLLSHFGIKKPLTSYHSHNMRSKGGDIIRRISDGESCAIITDAGMPCISDPGEELVAMAAQAGIPVFVVPGPNAAISALAISGLSTARFCFEGFLPVKKGGRLERLEALRNEERTLIFYEAPHKLFDTLGDMLSVWGERRIALARELTKLHEEVVRTTLSGALELLEEKPARGEYVIVVKGAEALPQSTVSLDEAVRMVTELSESGVPMSAAAKDVAAATGHRKSELYRLASSRGGEAPE